MRIAIIGATSQIAKDLILSFSKHTDHDLILFSRSPETVTAWLASVKLANRYKLSFHYDAFSCDQNYDAIFNFVGVGNPAQAVAMGASIFDVTYYFDELVLNYIKKRPQCRYIFLSSGAAYGASFDAPVDRQSKAIVSINNLQPQDWYAAAKLYTECRHRSLSALPIIDIRVFNYFSSSQDLNARFLICDIIRAIQQNMVLKTSSDFIVRDYLHPDDFFQLVDVLLNAPLINVAVDCYSQEPVSKFDLLNTLRDQFALRYEVIENQATVNATGIKPCYYSKNRIASEFGYMPSYSSIDGVVDMLKIIFSQ